MFMQHQVGRQKVMPGPQNTKPRRLQSQEQLMARRPNLLNKSNGTRSPNLQSSHISVVPPEKEPKPDPVLKAQKNRYESTVTPQNFSIIQKPQQTSFLYHHTDQTQILKQNSPNRANLLNQKIQRQKLKSQDAARQSSQLGQLLQNKRNQPAELNQQVNNGKQQQQQVSPQRFQASQNQQTNIGMQRPKSQVSRIKLPSYAACLQANIQPKNYVVLRQYYELMAKDSQLAELNKDAFFGQIQNRSPSPQSPQNGQNALNNGVSPTKNVVEQPFSPPNLVTESDDQHYLHHHQYCKHHGQQVIGFMQRSGVHFNGRPITTAYYYPEKMVSEGISMVVGKETELGEVMSPNTLNKKINELVIVTNGLNSSGEKTSQNAVAGAQLINQDQYQSVLKASELRNQNLGPRYVNEQHRINQMNQIYRNTEQNPKQYSHLYNPTSSSFYQVLDTSHLAQQLMGSDQNHVHHHHHHHHQQQPTNTTIMGTIVGKDPQYACVVTDTGTPYNQSQGQNGTNNMISLQKGESSEQQTQQDKNLCSSANVTILNKPTTNQGSKQLEVDMHEDKLTTSHNEVQTVHGEITPQFQQKPMNIQSQSQFAKVNDNIADKVRRTSANHYQLRRAVNHTPSSTEIHIESEKKPIHYKSHTQNSILFQPYHNSTPQIIQNVQEEQEENVKPDQVVIPVDQIDENKIKETEESVRNQNEVNFKEHTQSTQEIRRQSAASEHIASDFIDARDVEKQETKSNEEKNQEKRSLQINTQSASDFSLINIQGPQPQGESTAKMKLIEQFQSEKKIIVPSSSRDSPADPRSTPMMINSGNAIHGESVEMTMTSPYPHMLQPRHLQNSDNRMNQDLNVKGKINSQNNPIRINRKRMNSQDPNATFKMAHGSQGGPLVYVESVQMQATPEGKKNLKIQKGETDVKAKQLQIETQESKDKKDYAGEDLFQAKVNGLSINSKSIDTAPNLSENERILLQQLLAKNELKPSQFDPQFEEASYLLLTSNPNQLSKAHQFGNDRHWQATRTKNVKLQRQNQRLKQISSASRRLKSTQHLSVPKELLQENHPDHGIVNFGSNIVSPQTLTNWQDQWKHIQNQQFQQIQELKNDPDKGFSKSIQCSDMKTLTGKNSVDNLLMEGLDGYPMPNITDQGLGGTQYLHNKMDQMFFNEGANNNIFKNSNLTNNGGGGRGLRTSGDRNNYKVFSQFGRTGEFNQQTAVNLPQGLKNIDVGANQTLLTKSYGTQRPLQSNTFQIIEVHQPSRVSSRNPKNDDGSKQRPQTNKSHTELSSPASQLHSLLMSPEIGPQKRSTNNSPQNIQDNNSNKDDKVPVLNFKRPTRQNVTDHSPLLKPGSNRDSHVVHTHTNTNINNTNQKNNEGILKQDDSVCFDPIDASPLAAQKNFNADFNQTATAQFKLTKMNDHSQPLIASNIPQVQNNQRRAATQEYPGKRKAVNQDQTITKTKQLTNYIETTQKDSYKDQTTHQKQQRGDSNVIDEYCNITMVKWDEDDATQFRPHSQLKARPYPKRASTQHAQRRGLDNPLLMYQNQGVELPPNKALQDRTNYWDQRITHLHNKKMYSQDLQGLQSQNQFQCEHHQNLQKHQMNAMQRGEGNGHTSQSTFPDYLPLDTNPIVQHRKTHNFIQQHLAHIHQKHHLINSNNNNNGAQSSHQSHINTHAQQSQNSQNSTNHPHTPVHGGTVLSSNKFHYFASKSPVSDLQKSFTQNQKSSSPKKPPSNHNVCIVNGQQIGKNYNGLQPVSQNSKNVVKYEVRPVQQTVTDMIVSDHSIHQNDDQPKDQEAGQTYQTPWEERSLHSPDHVQQRNQDCVLLNSTDSANLGQQKLNLLPGPSTYKKGDYYRNPKETDRLPHENSHSTINGGLGHQITQTEQKGNSCNSNDLTARGPENDQTTLPEQLQSYPPRNNNNVSGDHQQHDEMNPQMIAKINLHNNNIVITKKGLDANALNNDDDSRIQAEMETHMQRSRANNSSPQGQANAILPSTLAQTHKIQVNQQNLQKRPNSTMNGVLRQPVNQMYGVRKSSKNTLLYEPQNSNIANRDISNLIQMAAQSQPLRPQTRQDIVKQESDFQILVSGKSSQVVIPKNLSGVIPQIPEEKDLVPVVNGLPCDQKDLIVRPELNYQKAMLVNYLMKQQREFDRRHPIDQLEFQKAAKGLMSKQSSRKVTKEPSNELDSKIHNSKGESQRSLVSGNAGGESPITKAILRHQTSVERNFTRENKMRISQPFPSKSQDVIARPRPETQQNFTRTSGGIKMQCGSKEIFVVQRPVNNNSALNFIGGSAEIYVPSATQPQQQAQKKTPKSRADMTEDELRRDKAEKEGYRNELNQMKPKKIPKSLLKSVVQTGFIKH